MLELILIIAAYIMLRHHFTAIETVAVPTLAPRTPSPQLVQLTDYADRLYAEKKWLAAEKAYLKVLKLDHKNITAYTHLGVIYSTQKNMADAIECFEIAARLRPSGSTYQNLGLAYYDNHNYIKSIAALEKANMFEPAVQRYVGLSKAQRKLSNLPGAIAALEKATALEPSKRILQLLSEAYQDDGRTDEAQAVLMRLHDNADTAT